MNTDITLTGVNESPRIDSRLLAQALDRKHHSIMRLIRTHASKLRKSGILRFQIEKIGERGRPPKYAQLNENQSILLLTLMNNTAKVVDAKVAVVDAFKRARSAAEMRQTQYLPTYHELHDKAYEIGGQHLHMNLNRLINKAAGVGSGQRRTLSVPEQSLIVLYQTIAKRAMDGAVDHHEAYSKAKVSIQSVQEAIGHK